MYINGKLKKSDVEIMNLVQNNNRIVRHQFHEMLKKKHTIKA